MIKSEEVCPCVYVVVHAHTLIVCVVHTYVLMNSFMASICVAMKCMFSLWLGNFVYIGLCNLRLHLCEISQKNDAQSMY